MADMKPADPVGPATAGKTTVTLAHFREIDGKLRKPGEVVSMTVEDARTAVHDGLAVYKEGK